ncbi:1-deoxy-D-xylulose-5-phosphate reductoisomerase [bacterium]|nr:1-deoxy-D-xylulose-5-phosphate reductoisomerase [bacterium]
MNPLAPLSFEREQNSLSPSPQRIAIYGSTGSIGRTALHLLEGREDCRVVALFANSSVDRFGEQLLRFQPEFAGLADPDAHREARERFGSRFHGIWLEGEELLGFAESDSYDTQLAAVIGIEGIFSALPAYLSGKKVALANKESLVVGADFFQSPSEPAGAEEGQTACRSPGMLVPVDSEHSSLFRLLHRLQRDEVRKIGLTASGGPFFSLSKEELKGVTVQDALRHPTWNMGVRITLDSATMMNKAFELIEAAALFGFSEDEIEVKVHPQSIIHGYVECRDGSHLFHGSPPDMSFPIGFALCYPEVPGRVGPPYGGGALELLPCDEERFRAVALARTLCRASVGERLRFYTANEVASEAFLNERLPFSDIVPFIDHALQQGNGTELRDFRELPEALSRERALLKTFLSSYS